MQRAPNSSEAVPVTEMAIVDTFTKLIFGEQVGGRQELAIIQAFRDVRPDVYHDSHLEMGDYLRNLGVREMIALVVRLREHMCEALELPTGRDRRSAPLRPRHSY